MRIIKKKCWPEYFKAVLDGSKRFDFRLADFDVDVGDVFINEEFDPEISDVAGELAYTGRAVVSVVTHIFHVHAQILIGGDGAKFPWAQYEQLKHGFYILGLSEPHESRRGE